MLLPCPAGKKIAEASVYAVITCFGAVLAWYSIPLVRTTHAQLSPALDIRMSYVYSAATVLGILCVIYSIEAICKIFTRYEPEESASC